MRQRVPMLSTLVNSTLVLFLLGVFVLVALTFDLVLESAQQELELKVFLAESVTDARAKYIQEGWLKLPPVEQARYVSREEAQQELFEKVGEDFLDAMGGVIPLPASINLRLGSQYLNRDSIVSLSTRLLETEGAREVVYPIEQIETVNEYRNQIIAASIGLTVLLALIAVLLIMNAVRLAIYSKRLIIRSMQLVGATNAFIRRPFLRIGVLQGLAASLIAIALLQLLLMLINQKTTLNLSLVLESPRLYGFYASLVVFGVLLGWLSSRLALRRFMDKSLEQLIR